MPPQHSQLILLIFNSDFSNSCLFSILQQNKGPGVACDFELHVNSLVGCRQSVQFQSSEFNMPSEKSGNL